MSTVFMRLAVCAICFFAFFSKTDAQVTFGPEVGFTAAGLYDEGGANVYAGFNLHIGGTVHAQLNDFLAVRPSLLFKTGQMELADDYDGEKYFLNRLSLAVPVLYSHIFGNSSTLFAGAGPNLMYTLSGKHEYAGEKNDIDFGSNTGQMKPFDMGLQLKVGYQFANGLSLNSFFNLGLSNLSNEPGETFKSMDALGFSIGWMFGGSGSDYY